jgi:hypothetical protein
VGLVAFLLLSHRPLWNRKNGNVLDTIRRTLGPSSYLDVGSFARRSLPATERYATVRQRAVLHDWGRRYGCHTCGSRGGRAGRQALQRLVRRSKLSLQTHLFVGDHQPPKSIAAAAVQEALRLQKVGRDGRGVGGALSRILRPQMGPSSKAVSPTTFRFYPQCVTCSNRQGSLLSAAVSQQKKTAGTASSLMPSIPLTRRIMSKSGRTVSSYFYNHGWRPRQFHLTGSVVAVWTTTTMATAEQPHEQGGAATTRKAWPAPRQWPRPLGGGGGVSVPNLGKLSKWMRPRPTRHT